MTTETSPDKLPPVGLKRDGITIGRATVSPADARKYAEKIVKLCDIAEGK